MSPGKAECDRAAFPDLPEDSCLLGEAIPDVLHDGCEEPGENAVGMAP